MQNTPRILRHRRIQDLLSKLKSTRCPNGFRTKCPRWKVALIGLLLTFSLTISGCASESNLRVEPRKVTVDASLMVTPNLTNEMLNVLSPSD
ncbi:Rz1-like spanin outer membrane subunit [Escherichia coli]|uniref:Rz1-like spanin outer membrane subunit n=1 Tax=Escherichia coli TaxID=562 RepID=UPI00140E8E4C|nr:hypothetical protein [Escherichia coli]